ncbi:btpA family domain-containing protein [Ditylenchus destructor]|nr:btpA family domain-containing protein [Ditylenchus destructor]
MTVNEGRPLVFGMLHLPALPGSPNHRLELSEIAAKVREETNIYADVGVDGLILENTSDLPYVLSKDMGPQVTSIMTMLSLEVKNVLEKNFDRNKFLLGIQILAGANREALAVAHAAGLDFIRAEGYIFSHVADEGWIDACAGPLLRYRKEIGAENIAIMADIKKKHCSHAVTSDIDTEQTAEAAKFFLADAIVVTGIATGQKAIPGEVRRVKQRCSLPLVVGSGMTTQNVSNYFAADAFIVGSHFKKDGMWENDLDRARIEEFLNRIKEEFTLE